MATHCMHISPSFLSASISGAILSQETVGVVPRAQRPHKGNQASNDTSSTLGSYFEPPLHHFNVLVHSYCLAVTPFLTLRVALSMNS